MSILSLRIETAVQEVTFCSLSHNAALLQLDRLPDSLAVPVQSVELLQRRHSLAVVAVHHRGQLGGDTGEAGVVLAVTVGGGRRLAAIVLAEVVITLVQFVPGNGVVVDLDSQTRGVVDGDWAGSGDVQGGGRRHPGGC